MYFFHYHQHLTLHHICKLKTCHEALNTQKFMLKKNTEQLKKCCRLVTEHKILQQFAQCVSYIYMSFFGYQAFSRNYGKCLTNGKTFH